MSEPTQVAEKYERYLNPNHIVIALKCRQGKKVPWPEDLKGDQGKNKRNNISRQLHKYKLEEGKLYYKIEFKDTIPQMDPFGTYSKKCTESDLDLIQMRDGALFPCLMRGPI